VPWHSVAIGDAPGGWLACVMLVGGDEGGVVRKERKNGGRNDGIGANLSVQEFATKSGQGPNQVLRYHRLRDDVECRVSSVHPQSLSRRNPTEKRKK
jgi:hypothetical protein